MNFGEKSPKFISAVKLKILKNLSSEISLKKSKLIFADIFVPLLVADHQLPPQCIDMAGPPSGTSMDRGKYRTHDSLLPP